MFGSKGGCALVSAAGGDSVGFASVEVEDFPHQGIMTDTSDRAVVQDRVERVESG